MRGHAGDGKPGVGCLAGAVIIALLPVGIGHDRLAADFLEGDVLRRHGRGAGNAQHPGRKIGPVGRQAQALHCAHRAADDRIEFLDPQRAQQRDLRAHHVAHGDHRKAHRPGLAIGRGRTRPGRAHAAAQDIGADHVETGGIDRLARPHHAVPPAGLAGDRVGAGNMLVAAGCVADEDGVVALRRQRAIGLIGNAHARKALPAVKRQRRGKGEHFAGGRGRGIHRNSDLGEESLLIKRELR